MGEVGLPSSAGRAVVAATVLGSALAYMSDDMLNPAIPSVAADLGGTVGDLQWVVNRRYATPVSMVLAATLIAAVTFRRSGRSADALRVDGPDLEQECLTVGDLFGDHHMVVADVSGF